MPIKPENRSRYPSCWHVLSYCIRADRAKWRCEWCGAEHGQPHPVTGGRVVLTVAHIDDESPENVSMTNLRSLCQKCHNTHDAPQRARRAAETRRARKLAGQGVLFDVAALNLSFHTGGGG